MVRSKAATVDAYLAELPKDERAALERLRDLVQRAVPGAHERIEYGMPYYRWPGGGSLGFASQRRHLSVYIGAQVLLQHAAAVARFSAGKGCLRFPSAAAVDWPLVETLIRAAAQ
ncbi:MAG: DUF1801 domain-containing protein [Thermoplasmata archaeon]|nr:DUF1801 domain-containing protein [Thermoplasmata archaeon]